MRASGLEVGELPKFQLVVSDPASRKAKGYVVEGEKALPLLGKEIGDLIDGSIIGLRGRRIKITGGTDKDGFPMLPSAHGGVKKRIILSKGRGFKGLKKKGKRGRRGQRKGKTIRGRMIVDDIYQINAVMVEKKKIEKKEKKPSASIPKKESKVSA